MANNSPGGKQIQIGTPVSGLLLRRNKEAGGRDTECHQTKHQITPNNVRVTYHEPSLSQSLCLVLHESPLNSHNKPAE